MSSKSVSDRSRSVIVVSTLIEGNAERTAAGVAANLFRESDAPPAGAAVMPPVDVAALCRRLGLGLRSELARLVEKDRAHELELADDVAPRAERDESFDALRKSVIALRSRVHAAFGDPGLSSLVLGSPCPREPIAAVAYARSAAGALDDASIALPAPSRMGGPFDREGSARILREQADTLERHVAVVQSEDGAAKNTLAAKNAAIESFDVRYRQVVDLMVPLWTAAGLTGIVEKLYSETRDRVVPEDDEASEGDPIAPVPAPEAPTNGTPTVPAT